MLCTRRLCSNATTAPRKRPFPVLAGAVYAGTLTAVLGLWLDERLDLRKWKRITYSVSESAAASAAFDVSVRARVRPPPIGAMEWPGGRLLLQWALDEGHLSGPDSGTVLTIGEGIGVTAIGLALARQQQRGASESSSSSGGRVVATDFCDDTLSLLRTNVADSGLEDDALQVSKWDAAGGEAALTSLPVPIAEVSHVIGADVRELHPTTRRSVSPPGRLALTLRLAFTCNCPCHAVTAFCMLTRPRVHALARRLFTTALARTPTRAGAASRRPSWLCCARSRAYESA